MTPNGAGMVSPLLSLGIPMLSSWYPFAIFLVPIAIFLVSRCYLLDISLVLL